MKKQKRTELDVDIIGGHDSLTKDEEMRISEFIKAQKLLRANNKMGFIKEPKGVDLVIGPSVLTEQDTKMISEIIVHYKRTGKTPNKTQRAEIRKRITLQSAVSKRRTPNK
ncbi:MAG: hypothetical protein ABI723_07140 [Bacteroidia bacterium]